MPWLAREPCHRFTIAPQTPRPIVAWFQKLEGPSDSSMMLPQKKSLRPLRFRARFLACKVRERYNERCLARLRTGLSTHNCSADAATDSVIAHAATAIEIADHSVVRTDLLIQNERRQTASSWPGERAAFGPQLPLQQLDVSR